MLIFAAFLIAILGYFLAGAIPLIQAGFISFVIWEIIGFVILAAVTRSYPRLLS